MNPPAQRAVPRLTPSAWDELRRAFHQSILIDTPLASLAQNIEGCAWALPDPDEKPSAYVDLTHAETLERLRARGLSPARFDDLADILRGTLAFDASFGAIAPPTTSSLTPGSAPADALGAALRRNLDRLGIPADFPLHLCGFAPGTHTFCREEGIVDLTGFLLFARRASRMVIVGGEFRDVLNALSHIDEATIARFLPFRPKSSGLHLVEALGLLVRPLDLEQRVLLARNPRNLSPELQKRLAATCAYFPAQITELRARHQEGMPLSRLVVSLDDLSLESAVCALLAEIFTPSAAPAPAPAPTTPAAVPSSPAPAAPKRWLNSLWPWTKNTP